MQPILLIAILILIVWLAYLTWQMRKAKQLFDSLVRVKEGSLSEILSAVVKAHGASKKEFEEVYKELERIDKEKVNYLQKVALVRFQPFGGDEFEQSFALALTDATGTGVVVTSIHTNNRARVYAKAISRGRSTTGLSPEEKKAVQQAMKS